MNLWDAVNRVVPIPKSLEGPSTMVLNFGKIRAKAKSDLMEGACKLLMNRKFWYVGEARTLDRAVMKTTEVPALNLTSA
jgi:hypothetical protein